MGNSQRTKSDLDSNESPDQILELGFEKSSETSAAHSGDQSLNFSPDTFSFSIIADPNVARAEFNDANHTHTFGLTEIPAHQTLADQNADSPRQQASVQGSEETSGGGGLQFSLQSENERSTQALEVQIAASAGDGRLETSRLEELSEPEFSPGPSLQGQDNASRNAAGAPWVEKFQDLPEKLTSHMQEMSLSIFGMKNDQPTYGNALSSASSPPVSDSQAGTTHMGQGVFEVDEMFGVSDKHQQVEGGIIQSSDSGFDENELAGHQFQLGSINAGTNAGATAGTNAGAKAGTNAGAKAETNASASGAMNTLDLGGLASLDSEGAFQSSVNTLSILNNLQTSETNTNLGPVRVSPPKRIRGARKSYVGFILRQFMFVGATLVSLGVLFFLAGPAVFSKEEIAFLAESFNVTEEFEIIGLLQPAQEQASQNAANLSESLTGTQGLFGGNKKSGSNATETGSLLVESDSKLSANKELKSELQNHQLKSTENESYFIFALEAIRAGDISEAIRLLQEDPPKRFQMKYDFDMASTVAARYYLFVGNNTRAKRVIIDRCPSNEVPKSAEICLPLLRAYVGLREFSKALSYASLLKRASDFENVSREFVFIEQAISAGQTMTPAAVVSHLALLMKQDSTDLEWERQQSLWILSEIATLGVARWRDLAQIIFQLRREEFLGYVVRGNVVDRRLKNSAPLTHFLDFLALRYGFEPLEFEHGQREFPTQDAKLGIIFEALVANMSGESEAFGAALHKLRGKKPYAEIERIIAVNVALQERRLSKAFHIMNAQVESIAQSAYSFEWKLAGIQYAVESNNGDMVSKLYQAVRMMNGPKYSALTESFDYWYAKSKLEVYLRLDPLEAIDKAGPYALSDRERGLLEAIKMEWLAVSGQARLLNVSETVQKYPWHYRLLSSAILAQGKLGYDPRKYIEMQNRVSLARMTDGREKNLLTDKTIENLILRNGI